MTWLPVALGAYFFLAIANLLDKFLVDNVLKSSKAYAFVACMLGALIILIAPWFLEWPGAFLFFFNLAAGAIFSLALWFLYEALKRGEAAKILVFIGGLTPVFSIAFSILFFKETYSLNQWLGISFLLLGVLVIALLPQQRSFLTRVIKKLKLDFKIKKHGLLFALLSAFAYSAYFIATKFAYSDQPFLSAFIWTRIGAALFVLIFLFNRRDRQAIKNLFQKSSPQKNKNLVIFNQILGASGFILQNYAVFLGSVAIVNALQGAQYAFLLIISAILAALAPKLLKETFSWRIVIHKFVAILVVAIGLYFLTIS